MSQMLDTDTLELTGLNDNGLSTWVHIFKCLLSLRVLLILLALSLTSRSSVCIRMMSSLVSNRALILTHCSMIMKWSNFLAMPLLMRSSSNWVTGVWHGSGRVSGLIWCLSKEWQMTRMALLGTWGLSPASVCWMLLRSEVLGIGLVLNSVAGCLDQISCLLEVMTVIVFREWGDEVLFLGACWFRWSLPVCLTAKSAFSFSRFLSTSIYV